VEAVYGLRQRTIPWINVKIDDTKEVKKTLHLGRLGVRRNRQDRAAFGNATAVSATLNGRPMKLTPTRSKTVIEDVITKDNYQKFVQ
jgi:hypothetical protein